MWWLGRGNVPYAALHKACLRESLESVKNIVQSGKFDIDCENKKGLTPLGALAFELYVCKCYGNRKKNLDLLAALEYEEKMKFLLKSGADPMKQSNGVTVAEIIFRGENKNLINMVLRYIKDINSPLNILGQTPLVIAIRKGFYKTAKKILAMGAKVNKHCCVTSTPLHCAALFQRAEFINLLIEHGGNMHVINVLGETALHVACYTSGEREMIKRCSELGLNFDDSRCSQVNRTISESTRNQATTPELVELLVDRGFYLEDKDSRGLTPLSRCLSRKMMKNTLTLLRNDAYLNINTDEATELMEYVSKISPELCGMDRIILKFIALEVSKGIAINGKLEQTLSKHRGATNFLTKCKEEIGILKSYKIENTIFTYWSLLAKSIRKLSMCASNNYIIERIKSFEADSFPIYGADLLYKFSKAKKRRKLMDICADTFVRKCKPELPSVFVDLLIDRLSMADLENVKIAGQYNKDD